MSAFDPAEQGAPSPTPPVQGGDGEQDPTGTAAQQGAGDLAPTPAAPAEAPTPAAEPQAKAEALWTIGQDGELTYRGVPLFAPNPNIRNAYGILSSLDTGASHEAGQKRTVTGTFPPEYEAIPTSGGAAYYFDAANGQGWSVALAPKDA